MLASRLAIRAARPALRPAAFGAARSFAPVGLRYFADKAPKTEDAPKTVAKKDPKAEAASIIDAVPSAGVLSKTGFLATTAAAAVYAISEGLYVVNDETILVVTFGGFVYLVAKVLAPLYGEYASGRVAEVAKILNEARAGHVSAVKTRIDEVANLKDVVGTTKALFEMSKETAAIEAEAFELKQKVNVASEAKAVLDSWVRYEGQVRQQEQSQLAQSVIANVSKQLQDPKFEEKVLAESVAEAEKLFAKEK